MDEKLRLLMEHLQIKSGQLAQALQVNPAMISHILNKRNRPGVEMLQRILATYPQVNPDWLMLGRGEMLRPLPEENSSTRVEPSLFPSTPETSSTTTNASSANEPQTEPPINLPPTITGKSVDRVVLFYSDGTFESFTPKV